MSDTIDEKQIECDGSINQCNYLQRIIIALKKYQIWLQQPYIDGQKVFIEYCMKAQNILNDYIHLQMTHHNIDCLNEIRDEMIKYDNVQNCSNIAECKFVKRHYNQMTKDNNSIADKHNFYLQIFDTIHCNIFHSEELQEKHNQFGLERLERFNFLPKYENIPIKSTKTDDFDTQDSKEDTTISHITFKWNRKYTSKKECDTKHMLYLLFLAIKLVNERNDERNAYFRIIGRTERVNKKLDPATIITNILDWHNKPAKKNEFNGELYESTDDFLLAKFIFEKICMIGNRGEIRMGDVTKIIHKLKKEIYIESDWIPAVGQQPKLQIPTYGYTTVRPSDKHLSDCSVEDIIKLLMHKKSIKNIDSNVINLEGVFEAIMKINNQKKKQWVLETIDDWKTKTVEIFKKLNIDGEIVHQTNRKQLLKSITTEFENIYKVKLKFIHFSPIIAQLKKCDVHRILVSQSQEEQKAFDITTNSNVSKKIQKTEIYEQRQDDTIIDVIFKKMNEIELIDVKIAKQLKDWLDVEEYDTDSLQYDINNYDSNTRNINKCNLSFIPNKNIIDCMYRIIHFNDCSDLQKYWLYHENQNKKK
eukprot:531738_1